MRKTYFISDLHLTEHRPDITNAFYLFLDNCINSDVDALYILGDFFEVWIGDDEGDPLALDIAQKLKKISENGTDLFFIHGNRDFLIGQQYADLCGMTLLPEQTAINLYGTPTVILHGDEMCTQDIEYQKFRKKSRGWWWPRLMLAMPLWYRRRVARNAREKSKITQMGKAPSILDVTPDAVQDMFDRFDVKNMIHGHTHRPHVHQNENHTRTVLGDWYSQSSYLVVTEHGQSLEQHGYSEHSHS
ncbi:UDP-2,3-diacylglucosamine diphosphatase [Pseudoalteromonas luteoviolacea]|uniref:UDP-2,3-diacylglucosamine hydrolase n=1 Tax=Pseudoalteromonas luteoviolacea NCIMB 1942 TaxID=1365253 RepID=A0A166Y151_9GAMM|nr:UDP-2,3-diacylglucosamine diphosphatase [Pseudoalteromonas luteoviolacea]KZN41239.1 UDP-2,3-diacylglucosamine hydrolase [Pseudoalteromonas luteoviolacea NCIMB 1942]KZX00497.1 UDP-2,3-diacylglucosamine hydrolase [Pseudoalteromonas luteoviolacea]